MTTAAQLDHSPHPLQHDFYSEPDVYDILHSPGTAHEVTVLERLAKRYAAGRSKGGRRGAAPTTWLEPACGSARYLRLAARRGYRVVGFDLKPEMVEYANGKFRKAGLAQRSTLFAADMRDFDRVRAVPPVDFAFNLINTIRHLPSDAQALEHLSAVARVLKPTGAYAVGISLCAYGREPPTEDVWQGSRGRCRVSQVVQYIPPFGRRGDAARMERVISHVTVTRGKEETHLDSSYGLRGYDLAQWEALIERSPLEIAAVTDSDGEVITPHEPGYSVFILKPSRR